MSTFVSTTFGLISGRHGSAIAAVMKKDRTNVLKVFNAPSNPKSDKQVAQRTKFSFVIIAMACLRDLFKVTFLGKGGANHGISLAFRYAVTGTSPDYSIDYSKLVLSEGSIYVATTTSAVKTTGTSIKLDWSTTKMKSALPTDNVSLVFLHDEYQQAILNQNCAQRSIGTMTVDLPAEWANGEIHCWIYFSLEDGSRDSASKYIAKVQL
jgi:hypothetical protein